MPPEASEAIRPRGLVLPNIPAVRELTVAALPTPVVAAEVQAERVRMEPAPPAVQVDLWLAAAVVAMAGSVLEIAPMPIRCTPAILVWSRAEVGVAPLIIKAPYLLPVAPARPVKS